MPTLIELFSGTGRVSRAFRAAGWKTITVDLFAKSDIRADVTTWKPPPADVVWASPPCERFSASMLPWHREFGSSPSTELVEASMRIIKESGARWWFIENVKGSVRHLRPLLGSPQCLGRSMRIWHNLPRPLDVRVDPWKEKLSGRQRAQRAAIPWVVAWATVAHTIGADAHETIGPQTP